MESDFVDHRKRKHDQYVGEKNECLLGRPPNLLANVTPP
jgi:hypothetical protein